MIRLTLKDGSVREVEAGLSAAEIVKGIGIAGAENSGVGDYCVHARQKSYAPSVDCGPAVYRSGGGYEFFRR